jgi:hypothetical protein
MTFMSMRGFLVITVLVVVIGVFVSHFTSYLINHTVYQIALSHQVSAKDYQHWTAVAAFA